MASLVCVALTAGATAQQKASPPDFSSNQVGWLTFRGEFIAVSGGPSPLRNDPTHPVVANNTGAQPTYRIGDLGNPNLKPWVVERMKKDNAEVLAGKIAFTPRSSCRPTSGLNQMADACLKSEFARKSPAASGMTAVRRMASARRRSMGPGKRHPITPT